ncbi:MAG: cytochrome P450 [Pseudomonadota bacterium]|uniref:Cytochrome P450 n=1 Tax=Sphingobium xenophagum TaxID=121428 RepID=A0A249MQW8_SPHXE|nr:MULTISPECIES: cytochrome P450 [Sphingobium]ASY43746.1 cytochrome P450 [Sphingobium xenophagum]OUC55726.1 cytochrome P450 [Sphingobium sp. GW456-12-10-14-TSB1]QWT13112.1 cytochrome P450 [Sphingobium xenophagum]|tara:strand:- start:604 stop:1980 length:1377 start_codon:yes stop_codon:yes gene_type:complete
MTEPLFTPPFPQPTRNKRTMLRRFFIGWHSWIHVLFEKSYTMKMGEVRGRGQLMYIANELPLVDRILKGGTEFPKHAELVKGLSPLIGNSVFSANGVDWENQRAMINPAFAHTAMNKTMPLMVEAVAAFLARIDGMDRRKAINIDAMMTHVAADIIFRTLFSQTLDTRRSFIIHQAFGRFQRYSHSASMLGLYGFPNRWFERWSERPANAIRGVFAPIVAERFNAFHAGQPAPHKDILQSLIEARHPQTGAHFTLKEVMDQVATIFLAGHETSASTMTWALYLLSECAHVQERARTEVMAVAGDAPLTPAMLKDMGVVRNVFRETLRLYPPLAFFPREVPCPMQMRDKNLVPGAMLVVAPWLTQRNKDNWACPHSFNPDRFDDPANADMIKQAWLPFSRGPRVCVGAGFAQQEVMTVIADVLRHYRLSVRPGYKPEPISRLTVRPRKGMMLMFEKIGV